MTGPGKRDPETIAALAARYSERLQKDPDMRKGASEYIAYELNCLCDARGTLGDGKKHFANWFLVNYMEMTPEERAEADEEVKRNRFPSAG